MAFHQKNMSFRRVILWCGLLTIILGCSLYFTHGAAADEPAIELVRETLSREEIDAANYTKYEEQAEAQIVRIKAEVAQLKNHPWAGEYSGGISGYLAISPNQGAALISGGCIRMYGTSSSVRQNGKGWLEFSPEKNKEFGFHAFDAALVPVKWGNRRYLIPEDGLQRFTTDINLGEEPRSGGNGRFGIHYLAVGDEDKPVSGLPDLPAEYLKMIRSAPVVANVRDVTLLKNYQHDQSCGREYRVTLDKGSSDGLSEGDTLRPTNPDESYKSIDLIDVRNQSAAAVIFVDAKSCTDTSQSPNKSWEYTTGAYVAK
jgi:hypothetical protein